MGKEFFIRSEHDVSGGQEFSINFWNTVFNDCYGYTREILTNEEYEEIYWDLVDSGRIVDGDPADEYEDVFKDPEKFMYVMKKLVQEYKKDLERYRHKAFDIDEPIITYFSRDFKAIENSCEIALANKCKVVLYGWY